MRRMLLVVVLLLGCQSTSAQVEVSIDRLTEEPDGSVKIIIKAAN